MNHPTLAWTAALCLLGSAPSQSTPQVPTLIADLNPTPTGGPDSSFPRDLHPWGRGCLFTAETPEFGRELWVTEDGHTRLVADINPGPGDAQIAELVVLGRRAVFFADDGSGELQVWFFDGESAEQKTVLNVGAGGVLQTKLAAVEKPGSTIDVYFQFDDQVHGSEPWVIEDIGAAFPVVRLFADLKPGPDSGAAAELTASGIHVFMRSRIEDAQGSSLGNELVIVNALVQGITELDLRPGAGSGRPGRFLAVEGGVIFSSENAIAREGVWFSDGSAAGTVELVQTQQSSSGPGPNLLDAIALPGGNTVYFSARTAANGQELWQSDRTAAGTTMIELESGPQGSQPDHFAIAGDMLALKAELSVLNFGLGLHPAGGATFFKFLPGNNSGDPTKIAATGIEGREFLVLAPIGTNPNVKAGLAIVPRDQGSAFAVQPYREIGSDVIDFVMNETSSLCFFVQDDPIVGHELFQLDVTSLEIDNVADLVPNPGQGNPVDFRSVPLQRDGFVMQFHDGNFPQLAAVDPTTNVVQAVPLEQPAPELATIGDTTLLAADIGNGSGVELAKIDAAFNVVEMVVDLNPFGDSNPRDIKPVGDGQVSFVADDGQTTELFLSDGTPQGTQRVTTDPPGQVQIDNDTVIVTESGKWIGAGRTAANGNEVVVMQPGQPTFVIDLNPNGDSDPTEFAEIAGSVLFTASDGQNGRELWITDCTQAGTMLLEVSQGAPSSDPQNVVRRQTSVETDLGGAPVLFAADDGVHGRELFGSDGTAQGTGLLLDIRPGPDSSDLFGFVQVNGIVFFAADDGVHGLELWKSDGTPAGTTMVADLAPGPLGGLRPAGVLTPIPGSDLVAFSADDSQFREDLFFSDGTAAGTFAIGMRAVAERARNLHVVGNRLVFSAETLQTGRELYQLDLSDFGIARVETYGNGCPGHQGLAPILGIDGVPQLGGAFGVTLRRALPSTLAVLAQGDSRTPIPLGTCALLVGTVGATIVAVVDAAGEAHHDVLVPNAASLAGMRFNQQWAVLDPNGTLGLLALSAAAEIALGN